MKNTEAVGMAEKNTLLQSPSQLHIVRTPTSCPTTPREVGDGMEMVQPHKVDKRIPQIVNDYAASITSSGYSTPVLPQSPRSPFDKRPTQHNSTSVRSVDREDAFSYRESLPSPVPSDIQMRKTEKFLMEEKAVLKDHLQIQIQVNQELKRLLVASIGEDMGFHYERIATEKAQLEMENEDLKKKLAAQEEEAERLNISCDVWRSKFLASRVQCDETRESSILLQRQQREMETAVRALLREHRLRSERLEETRDNLKHLYDALQWGKKNENALKRKKKQSEPGVDEECLKLSNLISSQLLGSSKPVTSKQSNYKKYLSSWKRISSPIKFGTAVETEPEYEVKTTLAEKYVLHLLKENSALAPPGGARNLDFNTKPAPRRPSGTVSGRFHPHTKYDNITLACCSKCKGDIHLI